MLAAAEADLEPELVGPGGEAGAGITGGLEADPGEGFGQQQLLARPERLAPLPAVQPVGRGFDGYVGIQRPRADFSAPTRSVFSQVKVPFSGSGVRPKWP